MGHKCTSRVGRSYSGHFWCSRLSDAFPLRAITAGSDKIYPRNSFEAFKGNLFFLSVLKAFGITELVLQWYNNHEANEVWPHSVLYILQQCTLVVSQL